MVQEAEQSSDGPAEYVDNVTIRIEFIPMLGQPTVEVWEFSPPKPTRWTHDWLLGEVERMPSTIRDAVLPDGSIEYELRLSLTRVEWGASGGAYHVALTLGQWAAAGIVGNALWDAFKSLAGELWLPGDSSAERPLTEEEATARATWHVRSAFSLPPDCQLAVVLVEQNRVDGTWTIGLQTASGKQRYDVTLALSEGLPMIMKMARHTGDPAVER
jgi:hypothetical protein